MLSSIVASKTARLIATCVCPVVGAGTLTMAVPKVRNAVHRATAPHEYALPKTRERAIPVSLPAPCTIGATPLSSGYIESLPDSMRTGPIALANDLPDTRTFVPDTPRGINDGSTPPSGDSTPPPGGVPEPHAWLQMIVGFTLVGGAVRMARKHPTEEEEEILTRVEDLKRDARL